MAIVNTPMRKSPLPAVITTRIDEVRRREARLTFVAGLLDALAIFLAAVALALVVDWMFTLFSTPVRVTLTLAALCAGLVGLVVLAFVPRLKRRSLAEVASTVDRSIPELEERWETVTRLSTSSEPETITGSRVLLDRVMAESVDRNRLVDPESIVPDGRLRRHQVILACAIAVNVALFFIDPGQTWVLLKRFCAPASSISLTQITSPSGDLAVARGEPVRLEAVLAGRPREDGGAVLAHRIGRSHHADAHSQRRRRDAVQPCDRRGERAVRVPVPRRRRPDRLAHRRDV